MLERFFASLFMIWAASPSGSMVEHILSNPNLIFLGRNKEWSARLPKCTIRLAVSSQNRMRRQKWHWGDVSQPVLSLVGQQSKMLQIWANWNWNTKHWKKITDECYMKWRTAANYLTNKGNKLKDWLWQLRRRKNKLWDWNKCCDWQRKKISRFKLKLRGILEISKMKKKQIILRRKVNIVDMAMREIQFRGERECKSPQENRNWLRKLGVREWLTWWIGNKTKAERNRRKSKRKEKSNGQTAATKGTHSFQPRTSTKTNLMNRGSAKWQWRKNKNRRH